MRLWETYNPLLEVKPDSVLFYRCFLLQVVGVVPSDGMKAVPVSLFDSRLLIDSFEREKHVFQRQTFIARLSAPILPALLHS